MREKQSTLTMIISSLTVLLSISVLLNMWLLSHENNSNLLSKGTSRSKCTENGFLAKEELLAHYRVGNNETLQSIAETQLHDRSRAHEIYLLNGEMLVREGFGEDVVLPEGMRLLIPPEEARFSSGNVIGVAGRIVKMQGSAYLVSPKAGLTISLYTDEQTKLERNFKVGDCVESIYYGDNSNKAVWIFPQT